MALLTLQNVSVVFGGIVALDSVSLDLEPGEILGLIGPNGSGKTTLFNCISGVYRPNMGRIDLENEPLAGLRPDQVAARGIGRTFQNIRLFHQLTAIENMLIGRHVRFRTGLLGSLFGRVRAEIEHREKVETIIEFLGLEPVRKARVGDLPFGIQRKVELGRALAMEPKVLLLDEPAAGLTAEEKQELVYYMREIRGRLRTAIMLVEHDLFMASAACDRMVALGSGKKIAEGAPDEVQNHPEVRRTYIG